MKSLEARKTKRFKICNLKSAIRSSRGGFTLIELAIVLVVLGMLIALGAALIGPLTKRAKFNESREVVKAAREAVIGYAIERKNLPASITDTGARYTDAWGNELKYFTNMPGVNLCTTTPTYLANVEDKRTTPSTTLINKVVVLLLSRGENGTNETGSVSPFTIQEQSSTYDDIVEYIDIAFLREKVCHALKITTESLPTGTEEVAYPSALLASVTLEATDGTTPYAWSIVGQTQGTNGCIGTDFPIASVNIGLCMTTGGVISGIPVIDGSYKFTVQVTDNEAPTARTATKSLTITINSNKPKITTEFLNYGYENQSYSATLSVTGGLSPYTWTALGSPPLPSGLSLTIAGVISGTPTSVPRSTGTYSFTATVTDNRLRPASKNLSIAINPP